MGFELQCSPSKDRKKVTLTIISDDDEIGVQTMIRVLANFIKQQIESNKISFEEVAIKDTDKARKI